MHAGSHQIMQAHSIVVVVHTMVGQSSPLAHPTTRLFKQQLH
jgi:hypothetical protein